VTAPSSDAPRRNPTTIRQVAARAGVSPATVSRVLAGTRPVTEDVRARVRRAIKELDYVVNEQARSLSGRPTKTVAILLDHLTSPFHNRVASGVELEASEQGRMCLVCTTGGDAARELELVDMLRARNTEAVVLIGGVDDTAEYRTRIVRVARLLADSGSQLVLVGRPALDVSTPVYMVEYDNEGGAYTAVSHLLSMGHRRIAYLGMDTTFTTAAARIAGYERALRDHGTELDLGLILSARRAESRTLGYQTMLRVLEDYRRDLPFTALFCFDDVVAAGAMAALREKGLRVPEDVSIVGYNDSTTALDVVPALTTVHIPDVDLGRAAVRLVLDRDEFASANLGGRLRVATYLVIRDSVRRLAPEPSQGAHEHAQL
jgi:LacI family transcriptional regulator